MAAAQTSRSYSFWSLIVNTVAHLTWDALVTLFGSVVGFLSGLFAIFAAWFITEIGTVHALIHATYVDTKFALVVLILLLVLYLTFYMLLNLIDLAVHEMIVRFFETSITPIDQKLTPIRNVLKRHWQFFLLCAVVVFFSYFLSLAFFNPIPCELKLGQDMAMFRGAKNQSLQRSLDETMRHVEEFAREGQQLCPFREALRAQHAQSMACLEAKFTVDAEVASTFAHGLFSKAGQSFPAVVRYSTSASDIIPGHDSGPKGMSIKIFGVRTDEDSGPFDSVSPDEERTTQDIILLSSPIFFSSQPDSYSTFIKAFVSDKVFHWVLENANLPAAWATLKSLIRIVYHSRSLVNPLAWTWFSTTPYSLGESPRMAVKYVAKPCSEDQGKSYNNFDGPEYIRDALRAHLAAENGCFDIYVQPQEEPCREPVEDSTIEWRTQLYHVGKLTIPRQVFDYKAQFDYCSSLAFNPWHSLAAHTPLGNINRQRREVYHHLSTLRRLWNNQTGPGRDGVFIPHGSMPKFSGPKMDPVEFYNRTKIPSGDVENFQYELISCTPNLIVDAHFLILRYRPYLLFGDDLPKHVAKVVRDSQFDTEKMLRIFRSALAGLFNGVSEYFVEEFSRMEKPNDYVKLFHDPSMHARIPWLAKDRLWELDSVFAEQWLRGMNPMTIRRVENELPHALDLTQKHHLYIEREVLPANTTVATLLRDRRLFYADYSILSQVGEAPDSVRYPAIILFYVSINGRSSELLPLAIQLTQTPDILDTVYLPPPKEVYNSPDRDKNTKWITWIFARMHVASADSQIHEMVSHLGLTHLMMEPIIIATYRQFARTHPIFRLLKPHVRQTIAINELGRDTLLNVNGVFDRITALGMRGTLHLISLAWRNMNFTQLAFPLELKSRGFDRVDCPGCASDPVPGFLYRDYGYLIWDALEKYVRSVVEKFYPTDASLQADEDVKRWAAEISDPLYGNVYGFPTSFTKREDLILILTHVIFTGSAQHSCVNFGQFDFYGFIPNRPLRLSKGMPPDPHTTISWKDVMEALPNMTTTLDQMLITGTQISRPDGDEDSGGDSDEKSDSEEEEDDVMRKRMKFAAQSIFGSGCLLPSSPCADPSSCAHLPALLSMSPQAVLETAQEDGEGVFFGTKLRDALEFSEPLWRPEHVEEWNELIRDLKVANDKMRIRNAEMGYNYRYLYYDEIAMSIAI